MLRRLAESDADLLREAYHWDDKRPQWYREMDAVFNTGTADDFVAQLADRQRAFVGVFEPELIAVIIVINNDGEMESHLLTKPKADVETITEAAKDLLYQLPELGMKTVSAWVAERNIGVRKLCDNIGLLPDGVVRTRGEYHNKPIRWIRHSVRREELAT